MTNIMMRRVRKLCTVNKRIADMQSKDLDSSDEYFELLVEKSRLMAAIEGEN